MSLHRNNRWHRAQDGWSGRGLVALVVEQRSIEDHPGYALLHPNYSS